MNKVLSCVVEYIPDYAKANIETISRNNDCLAHVLIIREDGFPVSPTIYLSYYYELYKRGEPFCDIMNRIYSFYNENKIMDEIDLSFFFDFNRVKDKIIYKLVNYEKNKKRLKDLPHIKYLDLAIVFCYYMNEVDSIGKGTILINLNHTKIWGVSELDLLKLAQRNTRIILKENVYEIPPMRILSNIENVSGAAVILYENLLAEIADKLESDLIIIPSSIHEVIVLPTDECFEKELIDDFIKTVNKDAVDEEEILSDHIYFYSRTKGVVSY